MENSMNTPNLKHLPPGWLTLEEAELLFRIASACRGDILEVGCYKGRSTVVLAQTGRIVHSVDSFKDFVKADLSGETVKLEFLANTKAFHNVRLYHTKVENWKVVPCGFCYLDGDHTYEGTISQICIAKKCEPTWIAVHDVNDHGGGKEIKRACMEQLGEWEERVGRLAVFRND